jgi:hypothetical protein
MFNQYHYSLKLPVGFDPIYQPPNEFQHNPYPIELLPKEYIDWFANLNIKIIGGEQFFLDPNARRTYYIHIDNPANQNHVKINYVFCDKDYHMNWYALKPNCESTTAITKIGTTYKWAKTEDCELLHSAIIGQPSLINASILHTVEPVDTIRYCFSFTLANMLNENISWQQAVELFNPYLV